MNKWNGRAGDMGSSNRCCRGISFNSG